MKEVLVILPVYKTHLNEFEKISLKQCIRILKNHAIALVAPQGLDLSEYYNEFRNFKEYRFKAEYFVSISSYNKLLMSSDFYKTFLDYHYILIYQLDAFVFRDELLYWCKKNYDYIGAPWIDSQWIKVLKGKLHFNFLKKRINAVGNGGLSLRKTKSFYRNAIVFRLLAKYWKYNEDFYWSSAIHSLNPYFKVAPFQEAVDFCFEDKPTKLLEINGNKIPFGCHAWEKYDLDFWRPYLKEFGYVV